MYQINYIDRQAFLNMKSTEDVSMLSPIAFEYFCKYLLEEMGYQNVQVTRKDERRMGADDGIDLLATKNGKAVAGQCKKWISGFGEHRYVPVEKVRALRGSMAFAGANEGIFISLLPFSKPSKVFAGRMNIRLVESDEIEKVLSLIQADIRSRAKNSIKDIDRIA